MLTVTIGVKNRINEILRQTRSSAKKAKGTSYLKRIPRDEMNAEEKQLFEELCQKDFNTALNVLKEDHLYCIMFCATSKYHPSVFSSYHYADLCTEFIDAFGMNYIE